MLVLVGEYGNDVDKLSYLWGVTPEGWKGEAVQSASRKGPK